MTRYHTALDRVDQVEEGSIQHQGETLLALARHFGDAPLDALKAGDSVYFDVARPGPGVLPGRVCAAAVRAGRAAVRRRRLERAPRQRRAHHPGRRGRPDLPGAGRPVRLWRPAAVASRARPPSPIQSDAAGRHLQQRLVSA
ncbi:hypothetical protein LP420_13680 [Massilia sp. B-10]|nr:hypothetical protein LP420_13680 [Massilia sp. B-10]